MALLFVAREKVKMFFHLLLAIYISIKAMLGNKPELF